MEWFKTLTTFSYKDEESEEKLTTDADRKLVPMAIEKVVMPKVMDDVWYIMYHKIKILSFLLGDGHRQGRL